MVEQVPQARRHLDEQSLEGLPVDERHPLREPAPAGAPAHCSPLVSSRISEPKTPAARTPTSAAVKYSGEKPHTGMDTTSATQRITLRTTAEPRAWVPRAKPTSEPRTPALVISR